MSTIGNRLRTLRVDNDFTQRELAEFVGTLSGRICDYETGRHEPSLVTLRKYGVVFRMTLAELLEGVR